MATQDQANAACEAIAARGERPTVERVRVELGGGSPNLLTPMVRAWKEAQRQSGSVEAAQAVAPVDPGTLPAAIQRAIEGVSAAVANLAPAFSGAVTEIAETERRRSRLEVEAALAGAKAQIEEARLSAEDERSTTDSVRVEVADKDAEISRLNEALEAHGRAHGLLEQETAKLRAGLDMERAARKEAKMEIERLAGEVSAFGMAVQTAQADAAGSKAASEAAQADAQRLREQIQTLTARLEAAQGAVSDLRTELAVSKKETEGERKRAERAEGDAERLRRERAEGEAVARDATARAAKAEAEGERARAEQARAAEEIAALRAGRLTPKVKGAAHGQASA